MTTAVLIKDAIVVGSGFPTVLNGESPLSFQASIAGTGALTGTVIIEGTNEAALAASNYLLIGTITLSGTTSDSDGFVATDVPWNAIRARIPAAGITGTDATIQVIAGYN